MTESNSLAVVGELNSRGLKAYYEYPGYVSLVVGSSSLNLSDINGDPLAIQIMSRDHQYVDSVDSTLSSETEDVREVANFMEATYRRLNAV